MDTKGIKVVEESEMKKCDTKLSVIDTIKATTMQQRESNLFPLNRFVNDDNKNKKNGNYSQEKWWQTLIQVLIPFFLAGIGTISAGLILGAVYNWEVFVAIEELFILIPALLGLKGNLDMTLASRLSTQANMGNMVDTKEIIHMVVGNIALVQVQAIVAGFIVSIFSITVGYSLNGGFSFEHAMLMIASSISTATLSCFVLDFVLVGFILISIRTQTNPDNMVTPLAASVGDVVSISTLTFIASKLFKSLETSMWIIFLLIGIYFILLPLWILVVLRNRYTRPVLKNGWVPVISALIISGSGGLVLMKAVGEYSDYEIFSPIINGIGGNLVSIQASRISTFLHQTSTLGTKKLKKSKIFCENPLKTLVYGTQSAKSARILIFISIPGQLAFIFIVDYIHMSQSTLQVPFILTYLIISTTQIVLLLLIAQTMIHSMWQFKIDPDSSAIPYLTALGDVLGSYLLLGAFVFLRGVGHEYGNRKNN